MELPDGGILRRRSRWRVAASGVGGGGIGVAHWSLGRVNDDEDNYG